MKDIENAPLKRVFFPHFCYCVDKVYVIGLHRENKKWGNEKYSWNSDQKFFRSKNFYNSIN
ncbi:MAG: hypothetical protein CL613_06685 [Aquimarina sp.]|nr:hypothetical protein [Aquimarina sp.]